MTREEVYSEIEEMFGLVPSFFHQVPDSTLELEWKLMKKVQFEEGAVPNKYRELIGIAIAGVTKCRYCALFHTEAAKLNGATDAEIEDAVHFAKSSAGWSTYLNGLQIDFDQFKAELEQAVIFMRGKQERKEQLIEERESYIV
jgi:AhpD family alkylhydroperoxidase